MIRNFLIIFFLSFSSGLPFLLVLTTFHMWLIDVGLDKIHLSFCTWITLPYSLKFILAIIIEKKQIPLFKNFFNNKKSWLLLSQLLLLLLLFLLSFIDPSINFRFSILLVFMISCFSAIQDIVIESFRVDFFKKTNKIGIASCISFIGYRLGMLVSGAGSLYLSFFFKSWQLTYFVMSFFIILGIISSLLINCEKDILQYKLNDYFILSDFFNIFNCKDFKIALFFIFLFKMVDSIHNTMLLPFLVELGFNKIEIANISKTFSILMMFVGGFITGWLMIYISLWKLLIISNLLRMLVLFLFILQSLLGHGILMLFVVLGIDNFVCGMNQVLLLSYFSRLCKINNTLYYAMLSSFSSFVRVIFSFLSGFIAEFLCWYGFYFFLFLFCFPSFFYLLFNSSHFINTFKIKN